ncbi:dihydroorotase [Verminephrobacter eiseniae]|uniref:Dihydroorotase n=1 Tax=Verminephrobacter eiseniae (strain EF01-2) TaxID=391735 RepID=A1WI16_VEREI|nr:dihydroorotase [Verminephrobacter eiseniae]ABM57273.1 dihydroorotase [Verminephrobacter eiseniae EF01-2]MCW5234301.1 dihydroorotase [Verminephrobacter eiseniae]MCW5262460.1 dihydroorotase [Verminephrobacter eiseniae]MCW5282902.1 dihydroorotase [Verminephrobacter eiseniae]MCW5294142.1 dihydroorotase [Verminephrobacter eiseniae]
MKILIRHGQVLDPGAGLAQGCDIALAAGRIVGLNRVPPGFVPDRVLDADGCLVLPGLVDLAARLREPGHEHAGMLASEMAAAVAGGVTSLVCPPDTDPVLDEPGLVEMLKFRAGKLRQSRLFPLGALTRKLAGEELTEMVALTESGCVGFGQAEVPLASTLVLQRALQYAATFGYGLWLRPQELHLGRGVAASGPLATRLGLPGVPVAAETIALHTIFELLKTTTGARVHLCRISSAAGVQLLRSAKAEGLAVSADVSINSLHLCDADIGFFDSRARLSPPLRQQHDRDALRGALADGTIDALVSDHNPVDEDAKTLPFAQAEPGATGLELLLSLALKWSQDSGLPLVRALASVTCGPARVLGAALGQWQNSLGRIVEGGVGDLCIVDPQAVWTVQDQALHSQGKHTPFSGDRLPGRVRMTLVGGQVVFERR